MENTMDFWSDGLAYHERVECATHNDAVEHAKAVLAVWNTSVVRFCNGYGEMWCVHPSGRACYHGVGHLAPRK